MKDGTTHMRKQPTAHHTFPGVLGVALLRVLFRTTVVVELPTSLLTKRPVNDIRRVTNHGVSYAGIVRRG